MDIYNRAIELNNRKEVFIKNNLPVPQELQDELDEANLEITREKVYYDCLIDALY